MLAKLKAAVRDITQLRAIAAIVARNLREAEDISSEISSLERDLNSSGSTRTVSDVRREINDLSTKM
jgi:DNA repair protein RAD50